MERLDRLGWADGLAGTAFGVRFGVRWTDASVEERIHRILPPGTAPAAEADVERLYSLVVGDVEPGRGIRRLHLAYANTARIVGTRLLDEAITHLESDLHLHVAERAPDRIFLHAGVVGWRGRAIVLPGRTLAGKTRLVEALLREGATYYSDEYAVLDARGRVHPYPRELSVREEGSFRGRPRAPASYGAPVGTEPLPVALVAVAEYRPGAAWAPCVLSAGSGALAMMEHAVAARRSPARALAAVRQVAERATVLRGMRGEASETARALLAAAERTEEAGTPR